MEIYGSADGSFTKLKNVYERNFEAGLDVGSSLAVTHKGKLVLDMWGGFQDRNLSRPWCEDTIINVWSCTKNMASLCILLLADKGQLDFSDPVTKYWPEFGVAGKSDVTISQIMSHSSGMSGWEKPIDHATFYNWEEACSLLAEQKPFWDPGSAVGYHAISIGYLLGEIVKRLTGISLGNFFKNEIADVLGLDFHIGTPRSEYERVAEIYMENDSPPALDIEDKDSVASRTISNPILRASYSTSDQWRAAEIPAAGGHGNGRSIAQCMAIIANSGTVSGKEVLSTRTVEKIYEEQISGIDLVLDTYVRWGMGFALPAKNDTWMSYFENQRTCFWCGWGGSLAIADSQSQVSLGYAPLRMEESVFGSDRSDSIVRAFVDCLSAIN